MANIKVNIDVESGQVEIASKKTLTLAQQVRVLRQELQKVPEGTKEWTLLQQKFNETKDSLDRVNVKSRELFGTFSALPGPIGNVAGQLDNTVGVLKTFSSLKFGDIKTQFIELGKDIKGIGGNLADLTGITKLYNLSVNALSKGMVALGVAEGAAATGAKALSVALIGTGIAAFVVLIGQAAAALVKLFDTEGRVKDAVDKTKEAIEKQNKAIEENTKVADTNNKLKLAQLKKAGADEETIRNQQIQNAKNALNQARIDEQKAREDFLKAQGKIEEERTKANLDNVFGLDRDVRVRQAQAQAKLYADNLKSRKLATIEAETALTNIEGDAVQDRIKTNQQGFDAIKKQREQDLENIKKNAENARLAILDGRKKEIAEVEKKYKEQIDLAKKYGKDTVVLEIARRAEIKKINDKYNEDEAKAALEFAKKLASITTAAVEDEKAQKIAEREEKYSQDLRDLETDKQFIKMSEEAKNAYRQELRAAADQDIAKINYDARVKELDDDLKLLDIRRQAVAEGTKAYFDVIREIENKAYEKQVFEAKGNRQKIEAIEAQHAQNMVNIRMQEKIASIQLDKEKYDTLLAGVDGLAKVFLAGKDAAIASVVIQKAAAIGQIVASTGIANAKAVAASPLTLGQPWVTINTISGGLSIAGVIAEAVRSINEIKNQGASIGAGGSSASAGAGGGGAAVAAFANPTIGAPQIGPTGAQEGTIAGIVAGSLAANNSQSRPIRAYVVGNDITSEMQLQRRIRTAARLGG